MKLIAKKDRGPSGTRDLARDLRHDPNQPVCLGDPWGSGLSSPLGDLGAGQLLGTEGFESRNRWKLRPGSTLTGKDWRMEGWGWGCQCGAEEIMKMLDHPNLVAITVTWFQ